MILHPDTAKVYARLLQNPTHALLIQGAEGAGKLTIAREFARNILGKNLLSADSSFRHFSPDNGSIGIEQIRNLQKFLHLKTMGTQSIRRVVIIEDAHFMTHEAQNALLKILEEPPADTVILLTVIPSKNVLPTIYSRAQQLELKTPSLEQTTKIYSNFATNEVEKAYMLSNGQQGLLAGLLEESSDHDLVLAIGQAKTILSKNRFERLAMVDELSKNKLQLPLLLRALKRIARSALVQSAKQENSAKARDWSDILQTVIDAESMLPHNPNMKLLLTNLMLTI